MSSFCIDMQKNFEKKPLTGLLKINLETNQNKPRRFKTIKTKKNTRLGELFNIFNCNIVKKF